MANLKEIEETFNIAKKYGSDEISLLYCVSKYPSDVKDFNLNNIKILKEKFKCKVGLSDHSKDNRVAIAAIAAGAQIVEKHIALDNQKKGLDIKFSLKGTEIKNFREDIDIASDLLGKNFFFRNSSEKKSEIFKRSIFTVKRIKKGEKLRIDNIRRIRPGFGLSPRYYEKLINKKSPIDLDIGEPLDMRIFKKI